VPFQKEKKEESECDNILSNQSVKHKHNLDQNIQLSHLTLSLDNDHDISKSCQYFSIFFIIWYECGESEILVKNLPSEQFV
jgi:hypothetical protein